MKITVIDASNYFKGLLLLIGKDRKITDPEIEMMQRIGKALGFEKKFCDTAIHDILENRYIQDRPPEFSAKELATKFIKDGLTLAASDNEIHPFEEEWLLSAAKINGLDLPWFSEEKHNAAIRKDRQAHLEVDDLTVEHT
jgi:hypothetical protein